MTQLAMNECAEKQYRKAETHLNAIYDRLLVLMKRDLAQDRKTNDETKEKFDETAIQELKAVQKIWLQYRTQECHASEQQIDGGSMGPAVWATCMTEVTHQRIEEIKDAYETPERKLE